MWAKPKRHTGRLNQEPHALPAGLRIYAIGDIHGCVTELDLLAEMISADISARACAESCIILLGDYIDRGPYSAHVLERLASGSLPAPFLPLRGNHEEMLLRFLDDPGHLT